MNILVLFILPVIIVGIVSYGMVKKVAIYEEFVVGAKDGFDIAVRIIPYLVAILFCHWDVSGQWSNGLDDSGVTSGTWFLWFPC